MFGLPYKLIGIIAGLAILAFWALFTVSLIDDRGKLKASLDGAIQIGNDNAQAATDQRTEFTRILAETERAAEQRGWNRAQANARRREIANAPKTDDGPIAAVLRRTLDGLPVAQGGHEDSATSPAADPKRTAAAVP
ncbi:MAG: hypothetical protein JNK21_08790 [Rhodospirillaceae bacterium]|nr:hypothetical protein [Rhodospirillaceae bacterium]